jgi:hypothetical protein
VRLDNLHYCFCKLIFIYCLFVLIFSLGVHTFYFTSDDGGRVNVSGTMIINNWTDHAATENTGIFLFSPCTLLVVEKEKERKRLSRGREREDRKKDRRGLNFCRDLHTHSRAVLPHHSRALQQSRRLRGRALLVLLLPGQGSHPHHAVNPQLRCLLIF